MPIDFQVTVDAAAPHDLARWWAGTLGWEVEPSDESFIREMIAQGHATEDETMVYDGVLVWTAGAAIVHPGAPDRGRRATAPASRPLALRLSLRPGSMSLLSTPIGPLKDAGQASSG